MGRKITAVLNEKAEQYLEDSLECLELDGGRPANESDVVNYTFQYMLALEKLIETVAGITDPTEFLKGINDGSILIVKK